jgi:arsenite methyltransferase
VKTPDYGVDAPPVIWTLGAVGVVGMVAGVCALRLLPFAWRGAVAWPAWSIGATCALQASLMILYAKVGKFRHRDRMLARIAWRGDEHVLDVGTGRGLLLIGAAKRLAAGSGRAVGVDVWSAKDLSGNEADATLENARLEGVADRVELATEDARKLSFPDASFDIVLSNLCIHNLPTDADRAQACGEVARVLKPGGRALISDFKRTALYARTLAAAGLTVKRGGPALFDTFPPLRVVEAEKPATPRG